MKDSEELKMEVSPICEKNGQKIAYVMFSDSKRSADGMIPDCRIVKNNGFSDKETAALEFYMQQNLAMLKRMAAGVNVMRAFTQEKEKKQ